MGRFIFLDKDREGGERLLRAWRFILLVGFILFYRDGGDRDDFLGGDRGSGDGGLTSAVMRLRVWLRVFIFLGGDRIGRDGGLRVFMLLGGGRVFRHGWLTSAWHLHEKKYL